MIDLNNKEIELVKVALGELKEKCQRNVQNLDSMQWNEITTIQQLFDNKDDFNSKITAFKNENLNKVGLVNDIINKLENNKSNSELKDIIADLENELSVLTDEHSDAFTTREIIISRLQNIIDSTQID